MPLLSSVQEQADVAAAAARQVADAAARVRHQAAAEALALRQASEAAAAAAAAAAGPSHASAALSREAGQASGSDSASRAQRGSHADPGAPQTATYPEVDRQLAQDRRLRAQQDADFAAALEVDRHKAEARAAAAAAAMAAEAAAAAADVAAVEEAAEQAAQAAAQVAGVSALKESLLASLQVSDTFGASILCRVRGGLLRLGLQVIFHGKHAVLSIKDNKHAVCRSLCPENRNSLHVCCSLSQGTAARSSI